MAQRGHRILNLGSGIITSIVENEMENEMKQDVETGSMWGCRKPSDYHPVIRYIPPQLLW